MTLIFGSIVGFGCGYALGRRPLSVTIVGLVWYAAVAMQTAHLAHPASKGFFGVDGLSAVQGHGLGQYWLMQIPILMLIAVLLRSGDKLRQRRDRNRPTTVGLQSTASAR